MVGKGSEGKVRQVGTHNLIRNVIVMGLPYAANAFIMTFKLAKIIACSVYAPARSSATVHRQSASTRKGVVAQRSNTVPHGINEERFTRNKH